jgi:hypothetical protein
MSSCGIAQYEVFRTPTACSSLMPLICRCSSSKPQLRFWNSLLPLYVHHLIY